MFYLVFCHQKYFTWKNNFLIFLKSAHPIPRKWLFVSIRLGFLEYESIKLFDISGKLYLKTSLTHQESQVTFLVTSGVVQEGPECTCLFNLYTDFVLHVFMNNCTQDDSIRFLKHQYRINAKSISREQLRIENT